MVHSHRKLKKSMYAWRCGFCDRGFGDMYDRDKHEAKCKYRKGARVTKQGRPVSIDG